MRILLLLLRYALPYYYAGPIYTILTYMRVLGSLHTTHAAVRTTILHACSAPQPRSTAAPTLLIWQARAAFSGAKRAHVRSVQRPARSHRIGFVAQRQVRSRSISINLYACCSAVAAAHLIASQAKAYRCFYSSLSHQLLLLLANASSWLRNPFTSSGRVGVF